MSSPDPSEERARGASPTVAAIVLAPAKGDLTSVFSSIEAQVYEPTAVSVVGEPQPESVPEGLEVEWAKTVPDAVSNLASGTDFVWILDRRASARPDALGALVDTASRVDASVVGSKLLDAARPDALVSVGGATDVFGYPYSGIEEGEVDQEQYDVIRDVAYVEPASMLVRRDLATGLGGLDPKLPYLSSGLDFCQRARLVGARVVAGPTSEVMVPVTAGDRSLTWREQAGRLRSMLKAYSPLTLLWAVPGLLLIGLLLSLYRTFNGSPLALFDWLRAWAWNALHLASTLTSRRRARAARVAGDDELFRYQVRGSVELRAVASLVGALLQGEVDEDEQDLEELLDASPGFWTQPAFLAAIFGAAFVLIFTRQLWSEAMPVVGFSLPLAESGWDVLRAYAGGWHLAGLGSPEPMHPSVGATAAVQLLFGSRTALAATAMTVASVALAVAGTTRLLRRLRIGHFARYVGGFVFVAGVPLAAVVGEGYWPALLAAGGLPWALASTVQALPSGWRPRLGRIARSALAIGWSMMLVPPLAVVPLLFGAAWGAATRTIRPLARAALMTVVALPLLFPWLQAETLGSLVSSGVPFFFEPAWWAVVPAFVAGGVASMFGRGDSARVAVHGALLTGLGLLAARAADPGAGTDLSAAGGVVASLGIALMVAGGFDVLGSLDAAGVVRRSIARVAIAGSIGALFLVIVALPAGRAGLPSDQFESLAFSATRTTTPGSDRLLLIGGGADMPGEFRRLADGTAYRLIDGLPRFAEARLPAPRIGDRALGDTLEALADGSELRPGAALAPFGVQWIVFTGDAPLFEVMNSQLDLRPLPQLVFPVFESEVEAVRAETESGWAWAFEGPDYTGSADQASVRLADNADPRWGPGPWEQVDWANQVSASEGRATFGGIPAFRLSARLAGFTAVVILGVALWGRPARREVRP